MDRSGLVDTRRTGATFRDKEDFLTKTSAAIRTLEQDKIELTRDNLACELMRCGVFQTSNIDNAVTYLKRAYRRYHISHDNLVNRPRRS
jgi:hypothetical protein